MNDNLEMLEELTCTPEETSRRITFCMVCEHNVLVDIPKCNQCDCPISSLGSMSFKSCPIGKW